LTLTGKVNGRERRFMYDDLQFPEKQSDNEFLPHLWAMRRVGHLLDQIRLNGESKELRDEIAELGTRYGIVTPYTSYLVLEPEMRRELSRLGPEDVFGSESRPKSGSIGGSAKRRQPAPDPTSAPPPAAAPVPTSVAGNEAVAFSKNKEELRNADNLARASNSMSNNRIVAGKNFYLNNGVWNDIEFKAEAKLPVVKLKFASEEYFNLIGKEPKLAEFFALGQNVVVVWKGNVYQVEE
jgi:Ca-activated chloride channel family protein